MTWMTPEIVEIGMNAEIGGYQSDVTDPEPVGPRGPVVLPGFVRDLPQDPGNRASAAS
jgi:hypothetical protein